jgi:hypothetical protein
VYSVRDADRSGGESMREAHGRRAQRLSGDDSGYESGDNGGGGPRGGDGDSDDPSR